MVWHRVRDVLVNTVHCILPVIPGCTLVVASSAITVQLRKVAVPLKRYRVRDYGIMEKGLYIWIVSYEKMSRHLSRIGDLILAGGSGTNESCICKSPFYYGYYIRAICLTSEDSNCILLERGSRRLDKLTVNGITFTTRSSMRCSSLT